MNPQGPSESERKRGHTTPNEGRLQKATSGLHKSEAALRKMHALESEQDISDEPLIAARTKLAKAFGALNKDKEGAQSFQVSIDAQIDDLEKIILQGLGKIPNRPKGLGGKMFPQGESNTDEWTVASFREVVFRTGMREYLDLKRRIEDAEEALMVVAEADQSAEREKKVELTASKGDRYQLQLLIDDRKKELEESLQSSPEVCAGVRLLTLREYQQNLDRGRLVETPYTKSQITRVRSAIQAGNPVFIHGHLGAGKTEIAIAASKAFLAPRTNEELEQLLADDVVALEKQHGGSSKDFTKEKAKLFAEARTPLIISGSKHTHESELYGNRTLNVDAVEIKEKLGALREAQAAYVLWKQENPQAADDEKEFQRQGLLKAFLEDSGGTYSDFMLGPIYRAMRQGRPIIIDEVDAIPHEVLISLNHILTRKPGDTVMVKQTGEELVVKEGFSVILTGNFPNEQEASTYVGRQEMDAAFLSRLVKMEHDYLPQSKEFHHAEALKTPGSLAKSELYHTLLARVMDRYGNMNVTPGALQKLWNVAVFARQVQDIFSGKWGNGGTLRTELGKDVLSLRNLPRIIDAWNKGGQEGNMKYPLDYYVFTEFVSQASTDSAKNALYTLGKKYQLFKESEGWPPGASSEMNAGVVKFSIDPPKKIAPPREWLSPRDTVVAAFGPLPPSKDSVDFPLTPEVLDEFRRKEEAGLTQFASTLSGTIENLQKEVDNACELPPTPIRREDTQ